MDILQELTPIFREVFDDDSIVLTRETTANDIDGWLQPKDVAGIEIYSEATVPNEFQQMRSGCGSIVIWKK